MKPLVILILMLAITPVQARCYSHWAYPWPQHCQASIVHARVPAKDWYVEIVLTPQVLDEISHGVGVEKIKQINHEEKP